MQLQAESDMVVLKGILLLFIIFFGIPNQIIDYKHRKKKAYEPGDAWAYYSRLSKEGSAEGKFMMCSTYCGIAFIVVVLAYLALGLFTTYR
ncbi:hypothetical protein [Janthinobacterium sp. ROICE36]|uniref:hypothetical protein n=1 Tax=Janthinobacterium sp. ROICE36 TaxID=2048670 RepID=UPI0011AFB55D|nr:hypothetical protein [Janthinobacterium sp. ROICE36]